MLLLLSIIFNKYLENISNLQPPRNSQDMHGKDSIIRQTRLLERY